MIDEYSTLEDVCYAVADALASSSIEAVLTGGAAAAIYAPNAHTSHDADFVLMKTSTKENLVRALATLGFYPSATPGMFVHKKNSFTIDFLKGPLIVGNEDIEDSTTLIRGKCVLRILTPTDCVRDRLARFYFWDDYTALQAAIGVAKFSHASKVNYKNIRRWTKNESRLSGIDYSAKFAEFLGIKQAPPALWGTRPPLGTPTIESARDFADCDSYVNFRVPSLGVPTITVRPFAC